MMQYSAIRTFSANLGDDIQTLAALRFLPRVDSWVDRERLPDSAGLADSFLIANGWFMHRPKRFPPPPAIHPFYISLHIHDGALLTADAIAHFRKWEPIGCRDEHTLSLLRSRGIAAYFSGCLTWTLVRERAHRSDDVFLVDVPADFRVLMPASLHDRAVALTHHDYRGFALDYHPTDDPLTPLAARAFVAEFRQYGFQAVVRRLPGSVAGAADVVSAARLRAAGRLLDRYSQARLVVTSRIHCYFPCLAFQTPAILVRPERVSGPQRLSIDLPFMRPFDIAEAMKSDWRPQAPDISPHRRFLELLCSRAVAIQDNPLRHESIDVYYQASGWTGTGVRRRP